MLYDDEGSDDISVAPPRHEHFGTAAWNFWKRKSVQRLAIAFAAVQVVFAYGVAGYMLQGWTFGEAAFMVVTTLSTVGYGEVRPINTPELKIHTVIVIGAGVIVMGYMVAGFVQFLAEGEIQQLLGHTRMRRQIDALDGHSIIAGFGRVGSLVCDELAASEIPFVVIEKSTDRIPEIERRGFLFLQGDATDEASLNDAGIARASHLIAVMPSDAENVFITLTARQLAPEIHIIARAEAPSTQKTLRQAGARHVITPAAIGAHRIVSLLTNPSAVEFAELVTNRSSLAIEMDEIPIRAHDPLVGHTLRDTDIGRRTGVLVIAVKRSDGRVEFPPSGDEPFSVGDTIVLLGRRSNLTLFRGHFGVGNETDWH